MQMFCHTIDIQHMLDSYPFPKYLSHFPPLIALLLPSSLNLIFTILGSPLNLNPEKSNRSPQMSSEKKRNPGRPDLPTVTLFIKLTNGHPQKQKALRRWTRPGDHDVSRRQLPNRLSHPGVPI